MDDSITAQQILNDVAGMMRMRASLGEVMELTPYPLALWSLAGAAAIVAARHRVPVISAMHTSEKTILKVTDVIGKLPPGEFADEILRPWNYGSGR